MSLANVRLTFLNFDVTDTHAYKVADEAVQAFLRKHGGDKPVHRHNPYISRVKVTFDTGKRREYIVTIWRPSTHAITISFKPNGYRRID